MANSSPSLRGGRRRRAHGRQGGQSGGGELGPQFGETPVLALAVFPAATRRRRRLAQVPVRVYEAPVLSRPEGVAVVVDGGRGHLLRPRRGPAADVHGPGTRVLSCRESPRWGRMLLLLLLLLLLLQRVYHHVRPLTAASASVSATAVAASAVETDLARARVAAGDL